MATTRVPITFVPANLTVWVESGSTVTEAAKAAGILVPAPCGGNGICGACGVRVISGRLGDIDDSERFGLRRAREGVRLACRARVVGPVTVRPFATQPIVATESATGAHAARPLVAGVDLGTTWVAAALVDPETGVELARAGASNRQQSFGADVLSRLSAAAENAGGDELRRLAEESVAEALDAAANAAGVSAECVERLVIAGNAAMAALFVGADTAPLATFPFDAPFAGGPLPQDSAVWNIISPAAQTLVVPPIAGFVGGDALAATLAAGMIDAEAPVMLVDLGTNAEIVLATNGALTVASAAAGPAFEGCGISCGGPATEGAITAVRVGDGSEITFGTIGDAPGEWLTGSGLVSAIAELVRVGAVDSAGRLYSSGMLADRVATNAEGVLEVWLGRDSRVAPVITQLDIRTFQLAKAAVSAGIDAVLAAAGVAAQDVERVYVAGAFGSALDPVALIALGVLPRQMAGRVVQVGDAALDGAATIALEPSLLDLAQRSALGATHVELASDPGFARALVEATELSPHGS